MKVNMTKVLVSQSIFLEGLELVGRYKRKTPHEGGFEGRFRENLLGRGRIRYTNAASASARSS